MPSRKDFTGRIFGRWTVVGNGPDARLGIYTMMCACSCGTTRAVRLQALQSGTSRSCGCAGKVARIEASREAHTVHGMADTAVYAVWKTMRARCLNPKSDKFKDYGGRGIRVCDAWSLFENFWADMGGSYAEGLTLEREDVNGPYSPENCVWIPSAQQARNRRNTRYVFVCGKRMLLIDAAMAAGLKYTTVLYRLRSGWSLQRALGADPAIYKNRKTAV